MTSANENAKGGFGDKPFSRLDGGRDAQNEQAAAASPVGTLLCATRMRMGKDLQHVAENLHIRYSFLVAIEDGRYEDLPGQAYAIGFVRAYADHLGLDGDEVVRRYKEESADVKRRSVFEFPLPLADSGVPSGPLILIAIVVGMLVYGVWYNFDGSDRSAVQVIQEVPAHLLALIHADGAPTTVREGEVASDDTPPASPEGEPGSQGGLDAPIPAVSEPNAGPSESKPEEALVELRAKADLWVTLRDAQKNDRAQFLRKDDVMKVPNAGGLTLLTGSGKDLEILVDGKLTPVLDEGLYARGVALDPQRLRGAPVGVNPAR